MCGIAGKISINANEAEMYDALKMLSHRGPDGNGVFSSFPLVLGHTRLAIQDLSEQAVQPMFSADKRYVIVYNGEVYNHQEIRAELIKQGIQFQSNSDTETLLYGYIHYGENILSYLNSIFSFAIFDSHKRELFVARDAYGVKPFYYYSDEKQFIFSSEIKAIMSLGGEKLSYNIDAQFQTLMLQWQMDENTGFKEIKKLLPGHNLKINIDHYSEFKITKWHQENFVGKYKHQTENDLINNLDAALTAAVQRQLLSDVPIAYFLSGGLDSSLLVAIAKKIAPEKTTTAFCLDAGKDFVEEGFSADVDFAKKVAGHLQIDLEIITAQSNFLEEFDHMIFHLEEAQADIAPLFIYQISKAASRKGFKVLISGAGADDVFSGYRRHQAISKENILSKTPRFIKQAVKKFVAILPTNHQTRRIKKLAEHIDLSTYQRMFAYFFWANKQDVLNLFSEEFRESINSLQIEEYFEKYLAEIPEEENKLNQMLHLEMSCFLPCHNLNYTDKMGMAASVEIRVPYLDTELVKFTASIPPELKLKGMTTKYLLKKVAENYLPKEVINRSKTGFGAPIRSWMQNDAIFQEEVWKRLSNLNLMKSKVFDKNAVQQMFKDTVDKKKDHSYTLLGLLAIESWMRQFKINN